MEPGCDPPPPGFLKLREAGCFVACKEAGQPCPSGGRCQRAWINPCVCSSESAGCCDACGGEALLCLP